MASIAPRPVSTDATSEAITLSTASTHIRPASHGGSPPQFDENDSSSSSNSDDDGDFRRSLGISTKETAQEATQRSWRQWSLGRLGLPDFMVRTDERVRLSARHWGSSGLPVVFGRSGASSTISLGENRFGSDPGSLCGSEDSLGDFEVNSIVEMLFRSLGLST